VLVFPPWDCLPYDTASPSAEAMGMRMSVLRRLAADPAPKVVVTSPEAALQRIPPASAIRSLPLRSGQELDAEALRRFCQDAGYTIDDRVDEPGEVAIRGGVIDIFPGGRSRPVRLELDGALLTAIRVYDPVTQRTTESISELEVDAVSELPPADDAESVRPFGAERRLPEACPELATLFDYLPNAALVESSDAAVARGAFLEQPREVRDGYARSEPQGGSSGPDRLYLLEEDWRQLVNARRCRTLDCDADEPAPRFLTQPRPRAAVMKFIKDQLGSGRRFLLTAPSRRELARLLRRAGQERAAVRAETWCEAVGMEAAGPAALEAPFDRGFVDAERSLAVITAHDLFGSRGDASGASEAATALWRAEAAELQLGDVVVHADRGVGRLEGIEPLAGAGACGEAIRVRYADGQDLLVPAAEAGMLWRYGSKDADVGLDRLTGDVWAKRRAKIEVGIAETARGLISEARQRRARQAPKLAASPADYERFAARFPFRLTPDQQGAVEATLADLGAGVR